MSGVDRVMISRQNDHLSRRIAQKCCGPGDDRVRLAVVVEYIADQQGVIRPMQSRRVQHGAQAGRAVGAVLRVIVNMQVGTMHNHDL